MAARRACITGILVVLVPLWVGCGILGAAFPQARGGLWPFLIGAAYCWCVLSCGGLCAYLVRLREKRAEMAAVPVPGRKAARR